MEFQWARCGFLCVGLDTAIENVPREHHRPANVLGSSITNTIVTWNRILIEATSDIAAAYKCNLAPYLAYGTDGLAALKQTIVDCNGMAPGKPVILDCKSGDVPHSNEYLARFAFEYLEADAITVHAYVGSEALAPFFKHKDKGIFVVCKTSNDGAGEFQDLSIGGDTLPCHMAFRAERYWNDHGNIGLTVSARDPILLAHIRYIAPTLPILAPGIGVQGGNICDAYHAGKDARGRGILLSVSRSISESKDPRQAAFALFSQLIRGT